MLINLIPEFLDILASDDREAAYHRYLQSHRDVLSSYWSNYVLDLDSPTASQVIHDAVTADRSDLRALLSSVDLVQMAEDAIARAADVLRIDRPHDTYLMVGVGGANAGELVINGRGVAFICIEHFTGRTNPETFGMGLQPDLIPLWIGHELAHAVRYTSPQSGSELRRLVDEEGGRYDYWETARRASLRELLVNEGLAVHASQAVAPGFDMADYFGYPRRQYQRMRELEAFLRRAVASELDRSGLGLRLRYLSGGMTPSARLTLGRVIPERCGYYLGYRMAEAIVAERGIADALRASAKEVMVSEELARGRQSA
ncbi:MAG: DUF2268 domain-containing putative Zn-dependent protease [Gemmatimonadota bacterium]|nr:DUF2268 domain-containing putative Zn-dependent protease [Gemmatimonadota bacterium]